MEICLLVLEIKQTRTDTICSLLIHFTHL